MALLALIGCALDEARFSEEYAEALCERLEDCADDPSAAIGFDTHAECTSFVRHQADAAASSCEYHADEARGCLRAVDDGGCVSVNEGRLAGCAGVFTGSTCSWTAASASASAERRSAAAELPAGPLRRR